MVETVVWKAIEMERGPCALGTQDHPQDRPSRLGTIRLQAYDTEMHERTIVGRRDVSRWNRDRLDRRCRCRWEWKSPPPIFLRYGVEVLW